MQAEKKDIQCDARRLERYLMQDLSAAEEAEVESHLEACGACRKRMRDSAGEASWWTDASRYLRADELDEESLASEQRVAKQRAAERREGAHATSEETADNTEAATETSDQVVLQQIQQWLRPTDDPRYLGRFGGYEILGVIGYGGMGVVLKGFEAALNRYVAIKVLAPALASSGAARQRFAREAQAAAAVLHENIIAIHRVDQSEGLPFLVMPCVHGVSLQKRIDDDGPLPLSAQLRIGRQVAAGLAAAHSQGLVHRDIKPANILLDRGVDRVTITDFGLARAVDDGSVTRTGFIAGTPQYMSPEQSRGEPLDARSDLFSLGSVLYAMSTGRPPFRAETGYGVIRRITDEQARSVCDINPEIPEWFEEIIRRLHAKSPDERFPSASEVAELFEQCLAHIRQPAKAALPKQIARPRGSVGNDKARRAVRGFVWGVAGLAFVMVLLTLANPFLDRSPPPHVQSGPPKASAPEQDTSTDAQARISEPQSPSTAWDDGADELLLDLERDAFRLERQAQQFWDDGANDIGDSNTTN